MVQTYSVGDRKIKRIMFESFCASSVEKIYSGIEKIFSRVANEIDGAMPAGDSWHSVLLNRMGSERPGIRPSVINRETLEILHELRGFRHKERNVYNYMVNYHDLKDVACKSQIIQFAHFGGA